MSQFYIEKPIDFCSKIKVSTVFIEWSRKILLLYRTQSALSPATWAIPGGKLEEGETAIEGLFREIGEELNLCPEVEEIDYIRSLYVLHPRLQYKLHLFRWRVSLPPPITLNPKEHTDYIWQPIEQFADVPLLEGQLEAFRFAYEEHKRRGRSVK